MPDSHDTVGPSWARVFPPETPTLHGLMTLAVSVVIVTALYLAREVLIPITLAVLLSFLLAPLCGLFRRIHLGRIPSVLLSVLIAVGNHRRTRGCCRVIGA